MNGVYLIIHEERKEVVAVCEADEAISKTQYVRNWAGHTGLNPDLAEKRYVASFAPIIPAATLKKVWDPIKS